MSIKHFTVNFFTFPMGLSFIRKQVANKRIEEISIFQVRKISGGFREYLVV